MAKLADVATFRLKTQCKLRRFQSNVNVGACRHLDDITQAEWMHVVFFFSVILLRLKSRPQLTSIVLDSAATKFIPESPEDFLGLTSG